MNKSFLKIVLLTTIVVTTSCCAKAFFSSPSSSTKSDCYGSLPTSCYNSLHLEGESNPINQHGVDYYEWNKGCAGFCFTGDEAYIFDRPLDTIPMTFEATIEVPKDIVERAGVIMGNFEEGEATINLEIYSNGNPRLFYYSSSGEAFDFVFSSVHVNNGKKLHLAIVDDADAGFLKCYVDGCLVQSLADCPTKWLPKTNMRIGSDARFINDQFFKGKLYNLSLFSSVRNEKEIMEDMVGIWTKDRYLITAFEMTNEAFQRKSISLNNNYWLVYDAKWLKYVDVPKDYSYSFAVIGDTQTVNLKWPDEFHNIYDYIINRRVSDRIEYCVGLGDITDCNTQSEWELAKKNIDKMNDLIPYSLNRGNHDSSSGFNRYFGKQSYYYSTIEGFYNEHIVDNSFKTLEINDRKYLIFALDYGVPDDVINWADSVIKQHKGYHIIVTTHAFLFRDGTTLDKNDVCPPSNEPGLNDGDQIWEKFIRKHNIDLVLCGHDPVDDIIVAKTRNDYGNVVTQILIDPQCMDLEEPTGMVAMLYFSMDGNTIDVRYYSTVKRMWLRNRNQFTIQINKL